MCITWECLCLTHVCRVALSHSSSKLMAAGWALCTRFTQGNDSRNGINFRRVQITEMLMTPRINNPMEKAETRFMLHYCTVYPWTKVDIKYFVHKCDTTNFCSFWHAWWDFVSSRPPPPFFLVLHLLPGCNKYKNMSIGEFCVAFYNCMTAHVVSRICVRLPGANS